MKLHHLRQAMRPWVWTSLLTVLPEESGAEKRERRWKKGVRRLILLGFESKDNGD